MNWVERRFARERNIEAGAPELWQSVLTAIEDACNSFIAHRPFPKVTRRTQNGHAVVVQAQFENHPTDGSPAINTLRVSFDRQQNLITSSLNDKGAAEFKIDADEKECFIIHRGERIDPDRLSELVLKDVFDNRPQPKPQYGGPSHGGGNSWMAS